MLYKPTEDYTSPDPYRDLFAFIFVHRGYKL